VKPTQRLEVVQLAVDQMRNDADLKEAWICDAALVDNLRRHAGDSILPMDDSKAKAQLNNDLA
jgi:hypothetical protein